MNKIKMQSEMVGGEFVSLVNLIINSQEKLKNLDKSNQLLECKIKKFGTGLSYPPKFGEMYKNIPLNRALEMHYSKLNFEINKMIKFNKLESELNKLSFGKVIEIKDLTKQEADKLSDLYKKKYIVRGPYKELNGGHNYILSFELNSYKKVQEK